MNRMSANKKQTGEREEVDKKDLFQEPVEIGRYLVIDPRVCHGMMTFKETRLPVETVLYFLSEGRSIGKILEGWPYLKREAIEEAIKLAAVAWPELLQEPIEKAINRLVVKLPKRKAARKIADEPVRPGRSH